MLENAPPQQGWYFQKPSGLLPNPGNQHFSLFSLDSSLSPLLMLLRTLFTLLVLYFIYYYFERKGWIPEIWITPKINAGLPHPCICLCKYYIGDCM